MGKIALTVFLSTLKRMKEINMAHGFHRTPFPETTGKRGFVFWAARPAPHAIHPTEPARIQKNALQALKNKKTSKWQFFCPTSDRI
jgi:hypothetical protein